MRHKPTAARNLILGLILATITLPLFGGTSCAGDKETINYGALTSGSAALVYIAQERGFFDANCLEVNVKEYATGVASTDALVNGEVDIAWSAEFPLVRRVFAGDKISIITASSRFTDEYLFARKDRGIERISDLKGKTIGVPRNTIAEFYLSRLMTLNGLSVQDVSLVDVQPAQSVDAITSDSVDAVVTWSPYTYQIREQLRDKAAVWSAQSSQAGFGLNLVTNEWLNGHAEAVRRFLKALARAEEYLVRNPEAGSSIIQERLNYDDMAMNRLWSENEFLLSLDQSLVYAMEDEARWMMKNGLFSEKTIPDFAAFVYVDALKAVKPYAVSIIK